MEKEMEKEMEKAEMKILRETLEKDLDVLVQIDKNESNKIKNNYIKALKKLFNEKKELQEVIKKELNELLKLQGVGNQIEESYLKNLIEEAFIEDIFETDEFKELMRTGGVEVDDNHNIHSITPEQYVLLLPAIEKSTRDAKIFQLNRQIDAAREIEDKDIIALEREEEFANQATIKRLNKMHVEGNQRLYIRFAKEYKKGNITKPKKKKE